MKNIIEYLIIITSPIFLINTYYSKDKTILKNTKYTKVNWYRKHLNDLKTITKLDTNLKVK